MYLTSTRAGTCSSFLADSHRRNRFESGEESSTGLMVSPTFVEIKDIEPGSAATTQLSGESPALNTSGVGLFSFVATDVHPTVSA